MVRIVCTMRDLSKIIPPKSAFFEMEKKLKIGWKWLKTDGMVLNRFGTLQQKHLASFHNKIVLRLSILKKISPTKSGRVISGQHGTSIIFQKST